MANICRTVTFLALVAIAISSTSTGVVAEEDKNSTLIASPAETTTPVDVKPASGETPAPSGTTTTPSPGTSITSPPKNDVVSSTDDKNQVNQNSERAHDVKSRRKDKTDEEDSDSEVDDDDGDDNDDGDDEDEGASDDYEDESDDNDDDEETDADGYEYDDEKSDYDDDYDNDDYDDDDYDDDEKEKRDHVKKRTKPHKGRKKTRKKHQRKNDKKRPQRKSAHAKHKHDSDRRKPTVSPVRLTEPVSAHKDATDAGNKTENATSTGSPSIPQESFHYPEIQVVRKPNKVTAHHRKLHGSHSTTRHQHNRRRHRQERRRRRKKGDTKHEKPKHRQKRHRKTKTIESRKRKRHRNHSKKMKRKHKKSHKEVHRKSKRITDDAAHKRSRGNRQSTKLVASKKASDKRFATKAVSHKRRRHKSSRDQKDVKKKHAKVSRIKRRRGRLEHDKWTHRAKARQRKGRPRVEKQPKHDKQLDNAIRYVNIFVDRVPYKGGMSTGNQTGNSPGQGGQTQNRTRRSVDEMRGLYTTDGEGEGGYHKTDLNRLRREIHTKGKPRRRNRKAKKPLVWKWKAPLRHKTSDVTPRPVLMKKKRRKGLDGSDENDSKSFVWQRTVNLKDGDIKAYSKVDASKSNGEHVEAVALASYKKGKKVSTRGKTEDATDEADTKKDTSVKVKIHLGMGSGDGKSGVDHHEKSTKRKLKHHRLHNIQESSRGVDTSDTGRGDAQSGNVQTAGDLKENVVHINITLIGDDSGEWGAWTACSATCGPDGVQKRVRKCPSADETDCEDTEETRPCSLVKPCLDTLGHLHHHAHTSWASWGTWGACSATCGHKGLQKRSRSCIRLGQGECSGKSAEHRACPLIKPCIGSARWLDWEQWSACSASCASGWLVRTRTCKVKNMKDNCVGRSSQLSICHEEPCPGVKIVPVVLPTPLPNTVLGTWTEWGEWSACSVTCGQGMERRERTCSGPKPEDPNVHCPGNSATERHCIAQACQSAHMEAPVQVREGSYGRLHCSYDAAVPVAEIYWITPKGDKITHHTGSPRYRVEGNYLYIKHAEEYDKGTYHCVVVKPDLTTVTGDASLKVATCADHNPCKNHGTCVEMTETKNLPYFHFGCRCQSGYRGSFCETDEQTMVIVVVMVVLSCLLMIIACITCYCFRARVLKKDQEITKTDLDSMLHDLSMELDKDSGRHLTSNLKSIDHLHTMPPLINLEEPNDVIVGSSYVMQDRGTSPRRSSGVATSLNQEVHRRRTHGSVESELSQRSRASQRVSSQMLDPAEEFSDDISSGYDVETLVPVERESVNQGISRHTDSSSTLKAGSPRSRSPLRSHNSLAGSVKKVSFSDLALQQVAGQSTVGTFPPTPHPDRKRSREQTNPGSEQTNRRVSGAIKYDAYEDDNAEGINDAINSGSPDLPLYGDRSSGQTFAESACPELKRGSVGYQTYADLISPVDYGVHLTWRQLNGPDSPRSPQRSPTRSPQRSPERSPPRLNIPVGDHSVRSLLRMAKAREPEPVSPHRDSLKRYVPLAERAEMQGEFKRRGLVPEHSPAVSSYSSDNTNNSASPFEPTTASALSSIGNIYDVYGFSKKGEVHAKQPHGEWPDRKLVSQLVGRVIDNAVSEVRKEQDSHQRAAASRTKTPERTVNMNYHNMSHQGSQQVSVGSQAGSSEDLVSSSPRINQRLLEEIDSFLCETADISSRPGHGDDTTTTTESELD